MRKIALLMVLALMAAPFQANAGQHVVSTAEVQQALLAAQAQRQADLATVTAALATPEAAQVAAQMGTTTAGITQGLKTLSDDELRDLAQRSAALTTDPVAGFDITNRNTLLTILIAVAIVYLVIQIVD